MNIMMHVLCTMNLLIRLMGIYLLVTQYTHTHTYIDGQTSGWMDRWMDDRSAFHSIACNWIPLRDRIFIRSRLDTRAFNWLIVLGCRFVSDLISRYKKHANSLKFSKVNKLNASISLNKWIGRGKNDVNSDITLAYKTRSTFVPLPTMFEFS